MVKIAEAQGIEVITECKGEKLVLDDQGAVVGIVAETSDKVITFNTASVVLATGGISAKRGNGKAIFAEGRPKPERFLSRRPAQPAMA